MEKQILHGFINSTHLFGECLEMEQLFSREIVHKNEEEQKQEAKEAEELNFSTTQFLQMLQQNDGFTFTNPFLSTQQEPTFQKLCKAYIKKNPEIVETHIESCITNTTHDSKFDFFKCPTPNSIRVVTRERKKRKRTSKVCKNKEEVENQRMTHIAVERNRRRQMNDYLNTLRTLMPPSYVQRGDQASIIGGAIDFVKELEQLLQSLQSQKRLRKSHDEQQFNSNNSSSLSSDDIFTDKYSNNNESSCSDGGGEYKAENKSETADIEVIVIQTHVNLKVKCVKKSGQLLKAIVALEDLRLTVLHLNITSFESSVFYSFNLKIEDDCTIGSADGIARSVHRIFDYINAANDTG